MSHLTLEALARLVDEAPDGAEREHLARCAECSVELAAMVEQSQALRSLPDLVPAPDGWPALRRQLKREGLLRERPRVTAGLARAAAAALLFLAGGALGYAVRGPVHHAAPPALASAPADQSGAADALAGTGTEREATRAVAEAGERFMSALDSYMAASGAAPADPATRLATLDHIVLTTAAALTEAPADPVINSYHMSAVAQRNAMLRQLAADAGQPVF